MTRTPAKTRTPAELFLAAHRLTRETMQYADDDRITYRATFVLCLAAIRAGYRAPRTAEQVAEDVAYRIDRNGMRAKLWRNNREYRVYIKRVLPSGNTQELGHIAVDRFTGSVRENMRNRRGILHTLTAA